LQRLEGMHRHVILVTLMALVLPGAAHASTADSQEAQKNAQRVDVAHRPALTLTLSAAGVYAPSVVSEDGLTGAGFHAHVGTDLFFNEGLTFFVGSGLELQYRALPPEAEWGMSYAPAFRVGLAMTGDNETVVTLLRRIPIVKLYAISGWRLPNAAQAGALRVGLGVSCFLVSALLQGAPGQAEIVMDTDFSTTSYHLRLGWGL
jgi:hypothetical protein